jgi:iron complex transport system ATP-binding protein
VSRLEAQGLAVALGGRRILAGIDLTLEGGSLIGLIGPNGAGKTTLVRTFVGLVRPAVGTVALDRRPLDTVPRQARARTIGYLPQTAAAAWPLPVRDIVALGRLPYRRPFGGPSPADDAAIDRALSATGTGDLADRRVDTLSGGERARVLLARVLAGEPRLLLADEPVAGLDPYHRLEVIEHLRALADGGTTVVVVLHDLTLAARFCDRVVMMKDGRVAGDGPPASVLSPERLAEVYRVSALSGEEDGQPWLIPWRREPG